MHNMQLLRSLNSTNERFLKRNLHGNVWMAKMKTAEKKWQQIKRNILMELGFLLK